MESIFSKIVSGEIPCYKVAENENYLAFLDISPMQEGHTLVIPKTKMDYIFDLEDEVYQGLFLFAKQVAKGLQKAIPCAKVGIAVIGLEVPYVHIHLVPLNSVSDMDFKKPKLTLDQREFQEIASKIRNTVEI